MKCPSCSKTIAGDSVFCSYCGMPIKDDYKTRQQIIRNRKEEQRRRSQDAADAMWSEIEPARKIQKPIVQPKVNYNTGTPKKKSAPTDNRLMSEVVTCPKCKTRYNMFLPKKTYLSFNTTCPNCNKKWKKRYWGRIFITIMLIILVYFVAFFYVAYVFGL